GLPPPGDRVDDDLDAVAHRPILHGGPKTATNPRPGLCPPMNQVFAAPKKGPYNRPPMEIRKLATPDEYLEAENVQKVVWHFPDREIIPLNELVVMQKNGGHVFGAFDGKTMTSFCFGVPGYKEGKVFHYSRMLGVMPGYQDSGIGYTMKLKQREYVLKQGIDLVVWTFDPLQSRN